jgi:hypothetical protein
MSASSSASSRLSLASRFPRVVLVGLAIVAVIATVQAPRPAAAASAGPTWKSGVFAGYGPAADLRFAKWRGLPVATGTDYVPEDSWASMDDPTWDISHWAAAPTIQPVLSVPLWPQSGGDFADAASGAYNTYFATLAKNLVAGGLSHAVLRIGWEPDGTWYAWSITNHQQAAEYASAWRQIVTAIQAVPGEHFSFDWCLNLVATSWNPAEAYPGDAYVSEIGEDVYDWSSAANQAPAARWNNLVNSKYGLAWQASFAASHGKPISFPEWGLVYDLYDSSMSGGDDPTFVQNMHDWFATHNLAFEDYFDSDSYASGILYGISTAGTQFPKSDALYKKLFS